MTGHHQRIISILKNRKTRDVKTTVMAEAEKSLVWWVAKKNKSKAEMKKITSAFDLLMLIVRQSERYIVS